MREKSVREDKREARRRWWKWKRADMLLVKVDICSGVRVERAAKIMVPLVFSSIMGSCANKKG